MVPNALLRHKALGARTKLVAMALLSYAFGDARSVEVSQSRIAADLRIARSTVNEEFRALVDARLIKTESRTGKTLLCDVSGLRDLSSLATGTCSQPRQVPVVNGDTNNTGVKTARTRASGTRARKNTSSAISNSTMPTDPNLNPESDGLIDPSSSSSGSLVPMVSDGDVSHARESHDDFRIDTETQDINKVSTCPEARKAEAKRIAVEVFMKRMRAEDIPDELRDFALPELWALEMAPY